MSGKTVKILGLGVAAVLGAGVGLAQAAPTSLQACLVECKKARLSETNRASCRLDCETEAASDPDLIRAQIGETQRPTPPATTPSTTPTPPATTPAPRPITPVSGTGCKAACEANRTLSIDDRASCKLDCDIDPDSPVNRTTPATATTPTAPPRGGSPLTFQLSGPPPSEAAQAGFLDKCYATCQQGPYKLSPTDFETCKLDCQTMASVIDVARGWVPDAWAAAGPVVAPTPAPVQPPTKLAAATPHVSPTPAKTTTPQIPTSDRSAVEICGDELGTCNNRCSASVKKCERGCGRKHIIETDRETCKLTCETDSEVCQNDCLAANATCVNSRQPRLPR